MKGLTLFKRRNQSQLQALATVQVPSTDLIMSDTGPRLPESIEITCQMTTEEFEVYMQNIKSIKARNVYLEKECLAQVLKILDYRYYPRKKVRNFSKLIGHTSIWYPYRDYVNFLPPRIINKIQEIKDHPHSPENIFFFIGDMARCSVISKEPPTGICFLVVTTDRSMGAWQLHERYYDDRNYFIIDAWRGPTFSDEEARLP